MLKVLSARKILGLTFYQCFVLDFLTLVSQNVAFWVCGIKKMLNRLLKIPKGFFPKPLFGSKQYLNLQEEGQDQSWWDTILSFLFENNGIPQPFFSHIEQSLWGFLYLMEKYILFYIPVQSLFYKHVRIGLSSGN